MLREFTHEPRAFPGKAPIPETRRGEPLQIYIEYCRDKKGFKLEHYTSDDEREKILRGQIAPNAVSWNNDERGNVIEISATFIGGAEIHITGEALQTYLACLKSSSSRPNESSQTLRPDMTADLDE